MCLVRRKNLDPVASRSYDLQQKLSTHKNGVEDIWLACRRVECGYYSAKIEKHGIGSRCKNKNQK